MPRTRRPTFPALLAGALLLLAGCSPLAGLRPPPASALEAALSGRALLGRPVRPEALPRIDPFALDERLEALAADLAARHPEAWPRARALHAALLQPPHLGGRGLRYDAAAPTLPAAEAYRLGRVNCLSYSLLYVALARRAGLDAALNDVEPPPSWDLRDDDTLLRLRHVNAKLRLGRRDELVVDLDMARYRPEYPQRRLADREATALFHANRALEIAAAGDEAGAFLHLRRALDLDPANPHLWNNLGNLYLRHGRRGEAEAAYFRGLALAPSDPTLLVNLANLYAAAGRHADAARLETRLRRYRERNPYHLYARARAALAAGALEDAHTAVTRALDVGGDRDPRILELAARIQRALGREARAARYERLARELDAASPTP